LPLSDLKTDCEARRMSSQHFTNSESLFRVDVSHGSSGALVALTGELDLATAPQLRACLAPLPEAGESQVVLDLSDLDFIDSTGLSVLVMAFSRTQAAGCAMVIRNPKPAVVRILEITGLASVFTISTEGETLPVGGG
jgi:anti-sigma B factor antagonist